MPDRDMSVRVAAAFVFGYEAAAIASGGRVPTITSLCLHHRWLGAAVVLSLAAHLILSDLRATPISQL